MPSWNWEREHPPNQSSEVSCRATELLEVSAGITYSSLAVPYYKVLHRYDVQNDNDLALLPGEWVTLEEAPYGGGWWRGTIEGKGTGWFPKTYIQYVDREAEKKKKQNGMMLHD